MKKKVIILIGIILLITGIGYSAYQRFGGSWYLGKTEPQHSGDIEYYLVSFDGCQYIVANQSQLVYKASAVSVSMVHKGDCNNPIHYTQNSKKK